MTEEIDINDVAEIMVRATQKALNEDFEAPNFLTATVVDTKTDEKFEFTVKRHEGKTPAEKLEELENKINEIKKEVLLNRRKVTTHAHAMERIDRLIMDDWS